MISYNVTSASSPIYFNVAEYCLFGLTLGAFIAIILYYFFVKRSCDTVSGFLFGGKNMSVFSITLGLVASHVTSITLLGVPVEIYMRGTQYWASALSIIIVTILTAFIYLPVFHKLQLSSSFEYLEIRFSSHTRTIAAVLYVVSKLMLLPIVPYVPLVAFRNVTRPLAGRVAALMCTTCAALCAVGGLRAVITASIVTTFVACVATALPGGLALLPMGFKQMWDIADRGGRIVFYDPDPELAHHTSFLAVTLALSTNWLWKTAIGQASMQRLLAVPTINQARLCLVISCLGVILIKMLSCFMGLVMYAWFAGCDPLLSGKIKKREQLVPYFLNSLSNLFPGICGVFLTAIFSATTCCMASIVNSISGVIFEEFIRPWMPHNTSEITCCRIMKMLCVLGGVYCGLVIWLVPELDRLLHLASGITGVTAGTLLGLFTLGIVCSRANCAGALSGAMVSLLLCGWLLMGAENALAAGSLFFQGKSLLTSNCTVRSNLTHVHSNLTSRLTSIVGTQIQSGKMQSLFRISFTYCTFAGALTVLVVGIPMSYLTKSRTATMNPDIFCPLTQSFLPRSQTRRPRSVDGKPTSDEVYLALDEALKHLKEVIDR